MATALDVIEQRARWSVEQADCLDFLHGLPAGSVDLIFGSPPYSQARLYLENGQDMGIARDTEEWVAWMVEVFKASLRVCKGLVAFVVEGQTESYRYSCGPALLMADLCRAGVHLRKPPVYQRVGIPGSGGPDWLRNDWEWVVCATNGGRLPWADNTAMGHPPKWAAGGAMSHRLTDGTRVNEWGATGPNSGGRVRRKDGTRPKPGTPGSKFHTKRRAGSENARKKAFDQPNGTTEDQTYIPPVLANPGNIVRCAVGGGTMGSELCHENEAPFPEDLVTFFVRSFCPEGGIVADCFSGSGTTPAVAVRWNRRAIACDLRQSQVELTRRRVEGETPLALFAE